MIGSMPHLTPKEALLALEQVPLTIPAWPQLPRRSFKEALIPQYTEAFPGIRVDEVAKRIWVQVDEDLPNAMVGFYENLVSEHVDAFAISEEYAAGLHSMLRQFAAANVKLPFLKGQVIGPFTFGLGLVDQERRSVWFDEQYRDIVLKGIGMKALWQIQQLQPYTEQVVIFFDEPVLSALGTAAYMMIKDEDVIKGLNEVCEISHDAGALVGVHCCGNMDWGLLASTKIDIIAFDAYFALKWRSILTKFRPFWNAAGSWLPVWCRPVTSRNCAQKRPIASRQNTKALLKNLSAKGLLKICYVNDFFSRRLAAWVHSQKAIQR
jgi:hypothetical protein